MSPKNISHYNEMSPNNKTNENELSPKNISHSNEMSPKSKTNEN
jgi:hypothetical protein